MHTHIIGGRGRGKGARRGKKRGTPKREKTEDRIVIAKGTFIPVQGAVQDGGEEDEGEGGVEVDREEGDRGEEENDNGAERREETNEQKEDTNEVEEEGNEVEVGTLLQVPGLLIPFVRFYVQWNYFTSC